MNKKLIKLANRALTDSSISSGMYDLILDCLSREEREAHIDATSNGSGDPIDVWKAVSGEEFKAAR